MGMEGPSKRVDNPALAEEMARASNRARAQIEEEKKINNGSEISRWGNLEKEAEEKEEKTRIKHETKERVKDMSIQELAREIGKASSVLEALREVQSSQ